MIDYNLSMKKLFLLILLSLGLTSISVAGYLDDDSLCGWMDNPSSPAHIVAEINMRGFYCDGDVAVKTVKTVITKESILESRFQRWKRIFKRWNKRIKVNPFSSEKSIKLISPF